MTQEQLENLKARKVIIEQAKERGIEMKKVAEGMITRADLDLVKINEQITLEETPVVEEIETPESL
jgi:hypothetical protein